MNMYVLYVVKLGNNILSSEIYADYFKIYFSVHSDGEAASLKRNEVADATILLIFICIMYHS